MWGTNTFIPTQTLQQAKKQSKMCNQAPEWSGKVTWADAKTKLRTKNICILQMELLLYERRKILNSQSQETKSRFWSPHRTGEKQNAPQRRGSWECGPNYGISRKVTWHSKMLIASENVDSTLICAHFTSVTINLHAWAGQISFNYQCCW